MPKGAGTAFDVGLVGLGPVGLTLAHLLCGEGLSVLAIDKRTAPHPHPRAIGLDHESMRVFQGIGLADALLPFTDVYRSSEYRTADGALLRRIVAAPEPYPLAWPPNLTFVQPELERLLLESAQRLPSLDLRLGIEVQGTQTEPDAVALDLKEAATGASATVSCRYVVGCDGAASPTRQALGIAFEDMIFDEPWLVVDVLLTAEVALPEVNIQFCDPRRPMTFVRGPGALRRWEIMMLPGERPEHLLDEQRIWQLLKPWLEPGQATIWRAATYRFHALVAERWRQGRVFLAGDACHQTPPFLAQGLNQGLRDAENLAWKLAAVVRGSAGDKVLDSYEAERRPVVHTVIGLTKELGRLICERHPGRAAERDAGLKAEMAAGRGTLVRQDLMPRLTSGLIDDAPGSAEGRGETCPQPWVRTEGGLSRMDDVIGRGVRILVAPTFQWTSDLDEKAERLRATTARIGPSGREAPLGEKHSVLIEADGVLAAWMAKRSCDCLVIRPDHAVYGVASGSHDLGTLLDRLLGALGAPVADGVGRAAPDASAAP